MIRQIVSSEVALSVLRAQDTKINSRQRTERSKRPAHGEWPEGLKMFISLEKGTEKKNVKYHFPRSKRHIKSHFPVTP